MAQFLFDFKSYNMIYNYIFQKLLVENCSTNNSFFLQLTLNSEFHISFLINTSTMGNSFLILHTEILIKQIVSL